MHGIDGRSAQPDGYDICIVGLKCYDFLSGAKHPKYLGGIEKDLVTIAKTISANGYSVAMLTYDHGQDSVQRIDGIDVIACFAPSGGLPILRFVYPRATRLIGRIIKSNATLTITMGVSVAIAWAAVAKALGSRTRIVHLTASDSDCETDLPLVKTRHEKVLYRFGLNRADQIFAQNSYQKAELNKNFSANSEVLRVPASAPGNSSGAAHVQDAESTGDCRGGLRLAWIGRLSGEKRPDWILPIAVSCDRAIISVIGGSNDDSPMADELIAAFEGQPNIRYLGKLRPEEMCGIYEQSDYVLNTSEMEGFPAVFREAWSYGVPIISTVDPDELISRNEAGIVLSTNEEMSEFLNSTSAAEDQARLGVNAQKLYSEQFSHASFLQRILAVPGSRVAEGI